MSKSEHAATVEVIAKMLSNAEPRILKIVFNFVQRITA